MVIKYSLRGPDATARQFRDLRTNQSESAAAIAGSINPMLQYLTGGNGITGTNETWSIDGTSATANNMSQPVPYDPKMDLEVALTVPKSGKATVTVQSWISVGMNAFNGQNDIPLTVGCRTGILILGWYDGNPIPEPMPGEYGGCQLFGTVWGVNNALNLGMSLTNSVYYAEMEPGRKVHFRTRRYYWGYAQDSNGSYIPLPSGSWYSATIQGTILQVTPVYDSANSE